jgi:hypothetical protein
LLSDRTASMLAALASPCRIKRNHRRRRRVASGRAVFGYVGANPIGYADPFGLTIYYANQPVVPGIYHSKLMIIPDDQSAWANDPNFHLNDQGQYFATIGAGPEGFPSKLVEAANRKNDVKKPCDHEVPLDIPSRYADENAAIKSLFDLSAQYNENPEPYALFPQSGGPHYNSNSFISGLLGAAGFAAPDPGAYAPGYNKPVPADRFSGNGP